MKNIFVICLLLITGLTQAQTFDFSCTASYQQYFDGTSFTLEEDGYQQLDLAIGAYEGSVRFNVNGEDFIVTSDGTSQKIALGDYEDLYVQINGGGTWTFRFDGVTQAHVVDWIKVLTADEVGNLMDYLPSTSINAVNLNAVNNVGNQSTMFYTSLNRPNGHASTIDYRKVSSYSITYELGSSTVHQFGKVIGKTFANTDSEDDTFNSHRIDGGRYHGWVLIKNGQSVDVIGKWRDGYINYALIIHSSYTWPTSQGNQVGYGSQYDINFYGPLPENPNFDN